MGNGRLGRLLWRLRLRGMAAVLLALAGVSASTAAEPVDRRLVEAAFVLNFLRYADWPGEHAAAGADYQVVVIGAGDAARALRQIAREARDQGGRRVRVLHLAAEPDNLPSTERVARLLDRAHAVFVADAGHPLTDQVIELASRRPVLSIGVGAAFAHAGGMLALIEHQGRLAFTCNEAAVLRSPVLVSTKVLRIARPLQPSSSLEHRSRQLLALLRRPGFSSLVA